MTRAHTLGYTVLGCTAGRRAVGAVGLCMQGLRRVAGCARRDGACSGAVLDASLRRAARVPGSSHLCVEAGLDGSATGRCLRGSVGGSVAPGRLSLWGTDPHHPTEVITSPPLLSPPSRPLLLARRHPGCARAACPRRTSAGTSLQACAGGDPNPKPNPKPNSAVSLCQRGQTTQPVLT